jgi:hypothetical protein
MAIAKSDRFEKRNLKIRLESETFPPESFIYEKNQMTLMGVSNKQDLMPNIDDKAVVKAVVDGIGIKQLIYSDQDAGLYDVCIYKDDEDQVFIYAIRTRQMPEKVKTVKKADKG